MGQSNKPSGNKQSSGKPSSKPSGKPGGGGKGGSSGMSLIVSSLPLICCMCMFCLILLK